MTVIDINHQGTANRAEDAARQLSNKQAQLSLQESKLAAISRDLVTVLGALKKAEEAQKKSCNPAVAARIEQLRTEIGDLQKAEDVAARIVNAAKKLIEGFLEEGEPTNRQVLEAAKEHEAVMQI